MRHILTNDEWKRLNEELDKVKYKCKCGHRNVIPQNKEKTLCSWCGNYVFKEKKDEFKYRMGELVK